MHFPAFLGLVAVSLTAVRGLHQPVSRATVVTENDTPVEIPLEVFQIQAPLRDTYDGAACSQMIVQKDFTNSYGSPYVGQLPWILSSILFHLAGAPIDHIQVLIHHLPTVTIQQWYSI